MKHKLNSAVEGNGTAGAYSIQHSATAGAAAQSLTPEEKLLAAMGNDNGEEPHPSDERSFSLLNLFTSCQVLSDEEIEGDCSLFQWGSMMSNQDKRETIALFNELFKESDKGKGGYDGDK